MPHHDDDLWLHSLYAAADQPPRRPRWPLRADAAGGAAIGSVEPDFLSQIGLQAASTLPGQLSKEEHSADGPCWRLHGGDLDAALAALANALRAAGLAGPWRDELLDVATPDGRVVARIERGAVRRLGIPTLAVHLVGTTPDGRHWVQQRALDKANDPGLWDTLVGGMVPAGETPAAALARETAEEAGLDLAALQGLRAGGTVRTRRPSADGGDAGWIDERIAWFHAVLPPGVLPENRDGEVAAFACLPPKALQARLRAGAFTLEAALVLADGGWAGAASGRRPG